ncbi:MAG: hypothetical protein Q9214_001086 [Letrouitia sp. 1 TL-2023]
MAQKTFQKSQLVAFGNAAAGHDGVLSDPSGAVIIKPCKQVEVDFYQSTALHPRFQRYIPTFMGTLSLGSQPDSALATATMNPTDAGQAFLDTPPLTTVPVVKQSWKPSSGAKIQTDLGIVLENAAVAFKKPNVLDVKLGARLWDEQAPAAKRAKLDQDAEQTTSQPLGLRIAGMQTWQGQEAAGKDGVNTDGYKKFDKHYGRALTIATVRQGFEEFFRLERGAFAKGSVRKIVDRFLEDLKGLKAVLESEESRMYSASLLFVYEGDAAALEEAIKAEEGTSADVSGTKEEEADDEDEDEDEDEDGGPKIQAMKLIDFAHAQWTPGQGPDENLLHGLRNTIKIFETLIAAD